MLFFDRKNFFFSIYQSTIFVWLIGCLVFWLVL